MENIMGRLWSQMTKVCNSVPGTFPSRATLGKSLFLLETQLLSLRNRIRSAPGSSPSSGRFYQVKATSNQSRSRESRRWLTKIKAFLRQHKGPSPRTRPWGCGGPNPSGTGPHPPTGILLQSLTTPRRTLPWLPVHVQSLGHVPSFGELDGVWGTQRL